MVAFVHVDLALLAFVSMGLGGTSNCKYEWLLLALWILSTRCCQQIWHLLECNKSHYCFYRCRYWHWPTNKPLPTSCILCWTNGISKYCWWNQWSTSIWNNLFYGKKKNTNHGNELFIQLPILTKLVNSTTYKVSIEWMQRKL